MEAVPITMPLDRKTIEELTAGTPVLISGTIYTARDAAHKRLVEALKNREELPFVLKGQTIYYTGPSPARPGRIIGSAGPTTSGRMDIYTPRLLAAGMKAMIGKGGRSREVREALQKYRAIYFIATGGAGALLAQSIKKAEVVAYDDLGPEAIMMLTVEDFPAIVADDIYGNDLFEQGKAKYRKEKG
jgi:fumarate hydratase subunit beta